jgi:hypothetical protein
VDLEKSRRAPRSGAGELVEYVTRDGGASVITDIFLARQPILDRDQLVQGYELLYPRRDDEQALAVDEPLLSARVVLNAFRRAGQTVGGSRRERAT